MCFSASIVIVVPLGSFCCLKENVLKSVIWFLVRAQPFSMTHTHQRLRTVYMYWYSSGALWSRKPVQHRNTVVVRVWGCSYMYSCELENGKRVTYGGWKLMLLSAESFVEKRFGSFLIFPCLWDVSWLAELWLFRS